MKNFLLRLLLFLVAIPALFLAVIAVPEPNYPLFIAIVIIAGALSGFESRNLFASEERNTPFTTIATPLLAIWIPAATTVYVYDFVGEEAILTATTLAVTLVLASQIFRTGEASIRRIVPSVSGHVMILLYPGLFLGYAIRMTTLPKAGPLIVVFLAAVFLNDTMAYVSGRLFGKRSGGFVRISPNKSLAGFIGGLLISPITIVVAEAIVPGLFPGSFIERIVFGFIIGITVITGDLVESGIKRSAEVKDSGTIIPGRGGILDSIDSPIFVAPFYYYLYVALFL